MIMEKISLIWIGKILIMSQKYMQEIDDIF